MEEIKKMKKIIRENILRKKKEKIIREKNNTQK